MVLIVLQIVARAVSTQPVLQTTENVVSVWNRI